MQLLVLMLGLVAVHISGDEYPPAWTTLTDDSLLDDCLQKALVNIHGTSVDGDVRFQVEDVLGRMQTINGMNIMLSFVLRGQKWQCSFYKSFVRTFDVQLEQCKQANDDPLPVMNAVHDEGQPSPGNADEQDAPMIQETDIENNDDKSNINAMNQEVPKVKGDEHQ